MVALRGSVTGQADLGALARAASPAELDSLFRREWGGVLARLIRFLGDFDLAEDALQDATVSALERWPAARLPDTPGAWLLTTARRKAIDRIRRETKRDELHRAALLCAEDDREEVTMSSITDDRLRLIFTCCHHALGIDAQVTLTLRPLGGLRRPVEHRGRHRRRQTDLRRRAGPKPQTGSSPPHRPPRTDLPNPDHPVVCPCRAPPRRRRRTPRPRTLVHHQDPTLGRGHARQAPPRPHRHPISATSPRAATPAEIHAIRLAWETAAA